ncbi:hypothetical protein U1Q18_015935 [Sarracenia purpurea var. burkii]
MYHSHLLLFINGSINVMVANKLFPNTSTGIRLPGNGFQKLDKIKDSNRQSKQLEELAGKMRECKRLIKEFDREIKDEESRNPHEVNKQFNDEKQSMVDKRAEFIRGLEKNRNEDTTHSNFLLYLFSYGLTIGIYMSSLGNKRVELFDMGAGASNPTADDNIQVASGETGTIFVSAVEIAVWYLGKESMATC